MLIKSALATSISGSIGGLTGARNRSGLYLRARTVPVNTNTPRQQAVRDALTELVQAWGTLLPAQREGWSIYGQAVPTINGLGDPIPLSGIAAYVRANTPRLQAGLARVDNPPGTLTGGLPVADLAIGNLADDEIDISFTTAGLTDAESAVLLYAGRPTSPGRVFFAGPYRLAGSAAGSVTPPTGLTVAPPYPVLTGQRVNLRVIVTYADGRLSGESRIAGIVS